MRVLESLLIPGMVLAASHACAVTFSVTTTEDSGPGSFRQAVVDANANAGADEVVFNIPPGGDKVILISGNPVVLGGSIDILGSTQPGFSSVPIITLAADPENPPDILVDTGITLGGHTISDIRFEGHADVQTLLRLFTVGNSVVNCDFDGKGSMGNGAIVGGIAVNTEIINSSFRNSGVGIAQSIIGAATTISGCNIHNNGIGIELVLPVGIQVLTETATITDCVITGNSGAGIRNHGGIVSRVLVRNNSIYNNGGLGIDNANEGITFNNDDLLNDLLGDLGVLSLAMPKSAAVQGLLGDIIGDLDIFDDILDLLSGELGLLPEELLENLLGNLGLLPDDLLDLESLLGILNLVPEDLTNLEDLLSVGGTLPGGLLGLDDLLARLGVNVNSLLQSLLTDLGLTDALMVGSVNHPVITSAVWEDGGLRVTGTVNTFTLLNVDIDFYLSPNDGDSSAEGKTPIGSTTLQTDLLGAGSFDALLPLAEPSRATQYLTATTNTNGVTLILTIPLGAGTSEFSSPAFTVPAGDFIPGANLDWIPSGMDSGPENPYDVLSPDDVDVEAANGEVSFIVRPSVGRFRNAGWVAQTGYKVSDIGAGNFLRSKFYVYASNAENVPINTVPNFRIRLQNESSVLTSANYEYSSTGIGNTLHEPYYSTINNPIQEVAVGNSLRPSPDPIKPSLYRLDFDPIEVPVATDTNILALFESYAHSDTANGSLTVAEIALGVYPQPVQGSQIYGWSNIQGLGGNNAGGTKNIVTGQFNIENRLEFGRRPDLFLPVDVPAPALASVTQTASGYLLDTAGVPANNFGVALFDAVATNPIEAPRVEPGKIYKGRFLVSSDAQTTLGNGPVQGDVYLSLKTGGNALMTRTEIIGSHFFLNPDQPSAQIASQVLPGQGNQMSERPDTNVVPNGETAAWYTIQMTTPMDSDIRQYANGDLGPLANEPGPGVNLPSFRDIVPGVVALKVAPELQLYDNVVPWSVENNARFRIMAMEIWSFNQIDDGGYNF